MNTALLNIVKQITAEYGEAVLADPARLKAFFSDLAKDEPKPLRIAFGRCVEAGAYAALKNAPDAAERAESKAVITQRLRDEHGLDPALCAEALDILEAAMPEEKETAVQAGNTAEEQVKNDELLPEEIDNLQKTIAKKNEELILCVQNIERLTEEKKQSNSEKKVHKKRQTVTVVLGLIAVAISIGVGVYQYNDMVAQYNDIYTMNSELQYNYGNLSRDFNKLSRDFNKLSSDYRNLSNDYIRSKGIWAINVTKLEVGNWGNSNWITKPGERLTSTRIRYLNPVITVDSLTSGEMMFFVKIINPWGEVDRNPETSPVGYTYSSTVYVSRKNNQNIYLIGWGNGDKSTYSAGEWTVEVWYGGVCLRSEKIRIN
jgi:hypothetical protein